MLADAAAPVAIVGGADGTPRRATSFPDFAERLGLTVATAFPAGRDRALFPGLCRQSRLRPQPEAGRADQGGGPDPGGRRPARRGDDRRLHPSHARHPGQLLVHVHPDPNELNRVYRADLAICAGQGEFAESARMWDDGSDPVRRGGRGPSRVARWTTPGSDGASSTSRRCLAVARGSCRPIRYLQRRGQLLGLVASLLALRRLPSQLAPTSGAMGYGLPAAVAAKLRLPERWWSRWRATAIS